MIKRKAFEGKRCFEIFRRKDNSYMEASSGWLDFVCRCSQIDSDEKMAGFVLR